MLFENNIIDTSKLPTLDVSEFNPLLKKYKKLLFINSIIFFGILAIIIFVIDFFIDSENDIPNIVIYIAYSSILFLFIIRLLFIQLGFPEKGYLLRQHDIIYKSGLLNKKIIAIPINRIQHSEIRQSYFARLLKISKIKIFTAGGNTSDLSISGLSPEIAQQIKDYLSNTISKNE